MKKGGVERFGFWNLGFSLALRSRGFHIAICRTIPEGPYIVESVIPTTRKYTLCFENGQPARDGAEVDEEDLKEKREDSSNTG